MDLLNRQIALRVSQAMIMADMSLVRLSAHTGLSMAVLASKLTGSAAFLVTELAIVAYALNRSPDEFLPQDTGSRRGRGRSTAA